MTLILSIENVSSLSSGDPIQVQLDEHGLVIGRAAHADWTLPDPRNHISSIHCEIDFVGGRYLLSDHSTNGTFINGSTARLTGPYAIEDGDLISIGQYEVRAQLEGQSAAQSDNGSSGFDWMAAGSGGASKSADPERFGQAPPRPLFQSASDPLMGAFAPPTTAASPAATADPFGLVAAPRANGDVFASVQPAAAAGYAQPSDPWAKLHQLDAIDFGASAATPVSEPPAIPADRAPPSLEKSLFDRFLAGAGLRARDLGDATPAAIIEAAGQLLRQTADGLIRLLDARTRVRHQFGVGANVTTFQRTGNNPLKWTRSPEQALRQLIASPDTGFLDGPTAVRGAFEDLQAHEMAMIAAMQEALQATVTRFSPEAIRGRATTAGFLQSVLPGAKEAALWRAYEAEFKALADSTDEGVS